MAAQSIRIRGQVQGVGFRPFVWQQANRFGVQGDVRNDAEGVLIHAEAEDLSGFIDALQKEPPPLARIDSIEATDVPTQPSLSGFTITASDGGAARTGVTPDAAVCAACAGEMLDPEARRHGYAFTNCTHCGPRFSIIEGIPYDRAQTTMRAFQMCAACEAEYTDPADRRFHAQPIACPVCGPELWFEVDGTRRDGDAIALAAEQLAAGRILAVKGIGGFQLACDATNNAAVALLRERKGRPAKPFALMAQDIETVRRFAVVDDTSARLLESAAAPIALLETKGEALAPDVAPGQWAHGWMLPTSPLHLLLTRACDFPLVMTSGNLSGEPQVIDNDEAREKLAPFVDGYLMHDRGIARRLDDSVARVAGGGVRMQRRARGYAPETMALPDCLRTAPATAAYGAFLKSAICLTQDGQALLSHHLGDLGDALTAEEFAKADADYAGLLDHAPDVFACDMHPDYPSTAHAEARAAAAGKPLERIQHHHAHIAAVMAETRWNPDDGPVLGVALDGLGWGPDDTVWGGEWLLCGYDRFERLACLKPVPLPGGGAAQREPWRNLMAQLDACGMIGGADVLLSGKPLATLRAAVTKGINAPLTSSAGRLFDAVAAAIGIAPDAQSFEGEAAMTLETLARAALDDDSAYPFQIEDGILEPSPMWVALLTDLRTGVAKERIAARFHRGLAMSACVLAVDLADKAGAGAIALSGGCFQNMTLLELCLGNLAGRTVLTHTMTPPNDGGLALGQAAIAAFRHRK